MGSKFLLVLRVFPRGFVRFSRRFDGNISPPLLKMAPKEEPKRREYLTNPRGETPKKQ